jgi:hypothetical protein
MHAGLYKNRFLQQEFTGNVSHNSAYKKTIYLILFLTTTTTVAKKQR